MEGFILLVTDSVSQDAYITHETTLQGKTNFGQTFVFYVEQFVVTCNQCTNTASFRHFSTRDGVKIRFT